MRICRRPLSSNTTSTTRPTSSPRAADSTQPRRKLYARADYQRQLDWLFPHGAFYEHIGSDGQRIAGSMFSRPIVSDVGDDWVEISSPPGGYPLPLSWRVPVTRLVAAQAAPGQVALVLEKADESGVTRRLVDQFDPEDQSLTAALRPNVKAEYFDFDFA